MYIDNVIYISGYPVLSILIPQPKRIFTTESTSSFLTTAIPEKLLDIYMP